MTNYNLPADWQQDEQLNPSARGTNIINVGPTERIISATIGTWLLKSGLSNITKSPVSALTKTILGGLLIYRGTSGNCPVYSAIGKTEDVKHASSVNIRVNLIVNKPRLEAYNFWRKLENLPLFMRHLATVKEIDNTRSHWEAIVPANLGRIKWNAEIVKEEYGSLIGWQSVAGSTIENAGKVAFSDALGGRGTELNVVISYRPPAGELGVGVSRLFNPMFEKIIKEDIVNFKEYIESPDLAVEKQQQGQPQKQSYSA